MEQGLPSYWVGLEIPETDCHVTLAFREQCTSQDLQNLWDALCKRIAPMLPLHLCLGAFQLRGTPPDIPAYNVFCKGAPNENVDIKHDVLQSFYHDFTRIADPDAPRYPRLEMHASCKMPEQRAQLERIIDECNGDFSVTRAYIRLSGNPENVMTVTYCSDVDDAATLNDQWAHELMVQLGYTQPQ